MARTDVLKPLTAKEDLDFRAHDLIVQQGGAAFVATGKALTAIADGKLWRGRFKNFDDYCRQRLGWSGSHGHRLADAAKLAEEIHPLGEIQNERQARELAAFPEHLRAEIFQRAQDEARGGSLTAAIITRVGIQVLDERNQAAKERRDVARMDEDEEADGDEESEDSSNEILAGTEAIPETNTPAAHAAHAARLTAPPKVHPLLRAAEHHRLGRKDSKKTVAADMEDPKLRQCAEQLAEDLKVEAAWLRRLWGKCKRRK